MTTVLFSISEELEYSWGPVIPSLFILINDLHILLFIHGQTHVSTSSAVDLLYVFFVIAYLSP